MGAEVYDLATRQRIPKLEIVPSLAPAPQVFVPPLSEDDLVDRYLRTKKGPTRTEYTRDIRQFREFLDALKIGLYDVEAPHVGDWMTYLLDERKPAGARRLMISAEGMYKTAMAQGWYNRNPFFGIKKPEVGDNVQYTGLDLADVRELSHWARHEADLRTRVLVLVLLTTGLRVSELCKARVEGLKPQGNTTWLSVIRKGGRRDKVEIPRRTLETLEEYIGDRLQGPILLGDKGGALARQVAWAIFRAAGDSALPHLAGKLHPHDARHTFVSGVLLLRGDPKEAKRRAGHRDINHTFRYSHALQAKESTTATDLEELFKIAE